MVAFREINWDRQYQVCNLKYMASANAVHLGENAYIGMNMDNRTPSIYKITRMPNKEPKLEMLQVLSWPLKRFTLAAFKGALLVFGGKFTSGMKLRNVGEYSNRVFTLSPDGGTSRLFVPPMRSGCASPAVVTHEGLIIVVHGEGADSGVEVLDTTTPHPDWRQVEPLPYVSATPSATTASGYLVVWIGAVYCLHLSWIMNQRKTSYSLPSNWLALPSPPESISLQLASHEDRLAAFAIAKDNTVLCCHFDQLHREWIMCSKIATIHPSAVPEPSIRVSVLAHSVAAIWQTAHPRTNSGIISVVTGVALPNEEEEYQEEDDEEVEYQEEEDEEEEYQE